LEDADDASEWEQGGDVMEEDEVVFVNVKEVLLTVDGRVKAMGEEEQGLFDVRVKHGKVVCVGVCVEKDVEGVRKVDLKGGSLLPPIVAFGPALGLTEIIAVRPLLFLLLSKPALTLRSSLQEKSTTVRSLSRTPNSQLTKLSLFLPGQRRLRPPLLGRAQHDSASLGTNGRRQSYGRAGLWREASPHRACRGRHEGGHCADGQRLLVRAL
jgi:hypothetical protein